MAVNYYDKTDQAEHVAMFNAMVAAERISAGGTPPSQTLRNVATRCRMSAFQNTSQFWAFSRTFHVNKGNDIKSLSVLFSNWYATYQGEFPTTGAMAISASVEYPKGVYTPLKWSGASTGSIPVGTNLASDALTIGIPANAAFWIRSVHNKTDGIFTSSAVSGDISANGVGDQFTSQAGVFPTDYTLNAYGGGSTANPFFPTAIIAMSNKPSVIAYGDSRCGGLQDAPSNDYGQAGAGEICRQIGRLLPYTNCGAPTDQLTTFNTTSTLRKSLAPYHTHVHCQYGINDVTAGRTAAQIEADMVTFLAAYSAYKVSQSTILPRTTSTDSWATLANQTVTAQEAVRVALNAYIRAKTIGWWAVFENADTMESARDSGKWKTVETPGIVSALTGDGTHPSPYGYLYLQNQKTINVEAFN